MNKWVLIETEDNDILEPDTYSSYTEAYIEMEKRYKEIYNKCFCVGGCNDDEANIHEEYAFVDYDAVRISWRIYEVGVKEQKGGEELNRKRVQEMWLNILEMLPHQPRSFDTTEDTGYWTNGSEILCRSELERENIADFLEDVFSEWGGYRMKTGYYDPFEDARNGEQDDNTGFYYIDMEE